MKQRIFLAITILIPSMLIQTENQVNSTGAEPPVAQTVQQPVQMPDPEKYDPTPAVLTHFGKIIGNFVNIIQDPENATNVGTNIAGMFGNIVNIALVATRSGKLPLNPTPEDIANFVNNLDYELKNELVKLVMNQTKKLTAIPAA